jgi:hypothetical protein
MFGLIVPMFKTVPQEAAGQDQRAKHEAQVRYLDFEPLLATQ